MTNFGGAVDLSGRSGGSDRVSDWLVPGDQNLLRSYLELSERVPVLILITDDGPESGNLRVLTREILAGSEGRFAALELSLSKTPQLAQAVGVSMAPAMLAILAGKPAPLFQGEVSREQLLQVLSQVLQLAAQNQITGVVTIGDPQAQVAPLSPAHERAFAAIEAGDLAGAKGQYESILTEYPNDQEAIAGLAQVALMLRLTGNLTGDFDPQMLPADQELANGNPAAAFQILLGLFQTEIEQRDEIRKRLLELFSLLGDSHPDVLSARRTLASLMF